MAPDEKDHSVDEFIEEAERSLDEDETPRAFDEEMLRAPISELSPRAPITIEPQASALEAISLMQQNRCGCVLVCRSGKLKGIFTERDVLTDVVGQGVDPAKTPVRKLMTENPEYLRLTDSIAYALNKMSVGGYRHVPLVDNARVPVGVISVKDIIGYIVRFFPKSVMNLPTLPRQNYVREREGA
jgi:CBS domain-containing protein